MQAFYSENALGNLPLGLEPQALLPISYLVPNQTSFLPFFTQQAEKDSVRMHLKVFDAK